MSLPVFVQDFADLVRAHPTEFCKDVHAQLERVIRAFETEDLIVEEERYKKYIGLGHRIGVGDGLPWERFLIGCMLCTYKADGTPRWDFLFDCSARGAGKDKLIEWISLCLISPYNPIKEYDVDIFGYVEDQAIRPVLGLTKTLSENPELMKRYFYWTKEKVKGKKNGGTVSGHANNPKAGDGLRSGAVIYNEVHAYENNSQLDVGISGLGKVPEGRELYFTTNGNIVGGPFDTKMAEAEKLLENPDTPDNGKFYFIWRLDSKDEVDDEAMWNKANPSLRYFPSLLKRTRRDYETWKENPLNLPAFMTKRMNLRQTAEESPAAEWDDILATNRPIPYEQLKGQSCTVGIDFASTTDWTGVNLHFVGEDGTRYDINHAWICLQSRDNWRLNCDYRAWADAGFLTLVDAPEIDPVLIAEWIEDMGRTYQIECVVVDYFRHAIVAKALEEIGFSVANKNLKIYRPSDLMKIIPNITRLFAKQAFVWGDNPVLRWATNNTKKIPAKKSSIAQSGELEMGNWLYGKIDPNARKTDPFMALVASMIEESRILPVYKKRHRRVGVITY